MGLARMGQAFSGLAMQGASLGMQMGWNYWGYSARLPNYSAGYPEGI